MKNACCRGFRWVVETEKTTHVSFTLKVAAVGEELTVTGETPIVDMTHTSVDTRLRVEEFQRLPVGRSYQARMGLTPGVVGTGNVNAHGALSGNNVFLFDGVDTTGPTTGTFGSNLNYDAIQEISIYTSAASAEYGRAAGAVVNVITKSGTNKFQGSAKYIAVNDDWDAQNKTKSETTGASLERTKFRQGEHCLHRHANPAHARDAGQAYLYLGIAYLGKGQELLAKAKFREAVQHQRELNANADQFPPKVVELVEAAKKEVAETAVAAARASPPPAAAPPSKGRSKLPFILIGGAAAAGGAALVAKGGAGDSGADFTRYYGTYADTMFTVQVGDCFPFRATLTLSGNPDGSSFQINKVFPPSSTTPPVLFMGSIQSNGSFTGSGGGYSITGQTTGRQISGSESRVSGPAQCTWTFAGSR